MSTLPNRALRIIREDGLKMFFYKSYDYLLSHLQNDLVYNLYNLYFRLRYRPGFDVMSEDWDILVLLDAGRYDMACELSHLFPGDVERRVTETVGSPGYIRNQYIGRKLHDTVYVTANPYASIIGENVFHAVDDTPLREYWDQDRGTVYPDDVTEVAIEASKKHPNKRLIIHYMQPHLPPIGETGDELHEKFGLIGYRPNRDRNKSDQRTAGHNLYTARRKGLVTDEQIKTAYRESYEIVLNEVDNLLSEIGGKAVISADHGEHLGERLLSIPILPKRYSHGAEPLSPEQCFVPWSIRNDGYRRKIKSDTPVKTERIQAAKSQDQLRALGYKV